MQHLESEGIISHNYRKVKCDAVLLVLASQQLMVSVAVVHAVVAVGMLASVFASAVAVSDVAGVKACSSYWCLT
jgi:hypothetical protein